MATRSRRLAFLVLAIIALAAPLRAASVTLAWDPNPEPEVRYIVHWGTQSLAYTASAPAGTATSYVIANLTPGRTYYFAVQASSPEGLLSPLSEEVSTFIPIEGGDAAGPTLTIGSHNDGATVTTSHVTVSGTASDASSGASGISSVTVNGTQATGGTATGGNVASWSAPLTLVNGANTITVQARDASVNQNLTSATVTITCDCPSTPDLRSLTASTSFPAPAGAPITFTATAAGGQAPLQYRYHLYSSKTNAWSSVQAYSTANQYTWTPTEGGTYAVQVWVRSAGSTATYQDWTSTGYFAIGGEPHVTSVRVQPTSPVRVGEPVTVTATVSGGIAPLQYKFWLLDPGTGNWTMLRDYATSNQATFTPTSPGAYSAQVWVRNAGSTSRYDAWESIGSIQATTRVALDGLSPNVASPVSVGTPVTWTAVGGGAANIEYKFWLYAHDVGQWTVLRDWDVASGVVWTPSRATSYNLQVWAREVGATVDYEAWKATDVFQVTPADNSLSITRLAYDRALPFVAGTPVNFVALSTGGVAPIEYQFWLYDGNSGSWSLLQEYSTSARVQWTPPGPGTYGIQVWARSTGSTARYDAWNGTGYFEVTGVRVSIASLRASAAFPVAAGTAVTWTVGASATDGSALEYQFWLHDQASGTWSMLQAWGPAQAATWRPTAAGVYHLQVWARRAGSTARYEAWQGTADLHVR